MGGGGSWMHQEAGRQTQPKHATEDKHPTQCRRLSEQVGNGFGFTLWELLNAPLGPVLALFWSSPVMGIHARSPNGK